MTNPESAIYYSTPMVRDLIAENKKLKQQLEALEKLWTAGQITITFNKNSKYDIYLRPTVQHKIVDYANAVIAINNDNGGSYIYSEDTG